MFELINAFSIFLTSVATLIVAVVAVATLRIAVKREEDKM